jgi:hypothetical protein
MCSAPVSVAAVRSRRCEVVGGRDQTTWHGPSPRRGGGQPVGACSDGLIASRHLAALLSDKQRCIPGSSAAPTRADPQVECSSRDLASGSAAEPGAHCVVLLATDRAIPRRRAGWGTLLANGWRFWFCPAPGAESRVPVYSCGWSSSPSSVLTPSR